VGELDYKVHYVCCSLVINIANDPFYVIKPVNSQSLAGFIFFYYEHVISPRLISCGYLKHFIRSVGFGKQGVLILETVFF